MAAKVIDLAERRRRRAEREAARVLGALGMVVGLLWLLRRQIQQMFPPVR